MRCGRRHEFRRVLGKNPPDGLALVRLARLDRPGFYSRLAAVEPQVSLRAALSGPWQAKQFSASTGRMWRLYWIASAASERRGKEQQYDANRQALPDRVHGGPFIKSERRGTRQEATQPRVFTVPYQVRSVSEDSATT